MTPTPTLMTDAPSTGRLWTIAVLVGVGGVLLLIGLLTGAVRLRPSRRRGSGRRAAMMLDVALSPQDRRAGLEYLLDDQHRVVLEQGQGDGDGEEPTVLYEYPSEDDRDPDSAD